MRRRHIALLLALSLATFLSGCSTTRWDYHYTDADMALIRAAQADPLLAGATLNLHQNRGRPPIPNPTVIPYHAELSVNGGIEPPTKVTEMDWAASQARVKSITDAGWNLTAVACSADHLVDVLALKTLGGRPVALVGGITGSAYAYGAFVLLATDPMDYWTPSQPLVAPTCLDQPFQTHQDPNSLPRIPANNYNISVEGS